MTEPDIIISLDDLKQNQEQLEQLRWGEEAKAKAANELLDTFIDDVGDFIEEPLTLKGVEFVLIAPEGQSHINEVFGLLQELKIEYVANY